MVFLLEDTISRGVGHIEGHAYRVEVVPRVVNILREIPPEPLNTTSSPP